MEKFVSDQEDWDFSDWCDFRQQLPPRPPAQLNDIPAAPPVPAAEPAPAPNQPPVVQRQQNARATRANRRAPERLGVQVYEEDRPLPGENDVTRPWCPGYTRDQY